MEERCDEKTPNRKIMEEIPQEPIAADPDEGDGKDEAEEEDSEDERIGQPVGLEDERR